MDGPTPLNQLFISKGRSQFYYAAFGEDSYIFEQEQESSPKDNIHKVSERRRELEEKVIQKMLSFICPDICKVIPSKLLTATPGRKLLEKV